VNGFSQWVRFGPLVQAKTSLGALEETWKERREQAPQDTTKGEDAQHVCLTAGLIKAPPPPLSTPNSPLIQGRAGGGCAQGMLLDGKAGCCLQSSSPLYCRTWKVCKK